MARYRRAPSSVPQGGSDRRWSKVRLLGLFFLFDALLVVAVLLSFQGTELIQEEVTLIQTREVFEVQIREQVITDTTVITRVMPYGWAPLGNP
jgi:hypothetical protein